MKKAQLALLKSGSPELVVAHAERQRSRGRRPSMAYGPYRNPEVALATAARDAEDNYAKMIILATKRGVAPGMAYTSVSGRHFDDPEQALVVAAYEAMILALDEETATDEVA